MTQKYISVKNASIYLDIPEKTLWRWVYDRKIPSYKIHGKRLLSIGEIESLIERDKSIEELTHEFNNRLPNKKSFTGFSFTDNMGFVSNNSAKNRVKENMKGASL